MRRSVCFHFFRKYLHEVSQGRGDREDMNPAIRFVKRAEDGAFDRCSDEYYETRLREAEELSAFWSDRAAQKAIDTLRAVLEHIELDRVSIHKMAQEAEQTRMGIRYLHSRIQQMLDEQMFWDHNRTEYRLSA